MKGLNALLRNWLKNKLLAVGLAIFATVLIIAIFAPLIAPHPWDGVDLPNALRGPSLDYPFGTDQFGRCLFSRVIWGSRIALRIGLLVVSIEVGVGIVLGLWAGYYGGVVDSFLSFLSDLVWSMPPIVLALAIVTALGPSLTNVVTAIALTSWPGVSRMVRAKTQGLKNMPYVEAARALGESDISIMFRYILPNTMGIVIVLATLSLPGAILSTTGLSFLGLGSQPPSPDWGVILSEGMRYISLSPWISIFPGLALIWTSLGFNMLGEGLRDVLDPRLQV